MVTPLYLKFVSNLFFVMVLFSFYYFLFSQENIFIHMHVIWMLFYYLDPYACHFPSVYLRSLHIFPVYYHLKVSSLVLYAHFSLFMFSAYGSLRSSRPGKSQGKT